MIRAWMFAGNSVDMSPDALMALTVPSIPLVEVGTAVIAETPVEISGGPGSPPGLTVPAVPTILGSTSVIAETPVTAGPVTLTVPGVPTVTVSTAVE